MLRFIPLTSHAKSVGSDDLTGNFEGGNRASWKSVLKKLITTKTRSRIKFGWKLERKKVSKDVTGILSHRHNRWRVRSGSLRQDGNGAAGTST